MKVRMLDPSLFTPPYDSALCLALQDIGVDVSLITRNTRPTDFPLHSRVNSDARFYAKTEFMWRKGLPGRLPVKAIEHVVNMNQLTRFLANDRPDIVHVQWFPLPVIDAKFVPRIRKIAPILLTVHDTQIFHGQASSRLQVAGWRKLLTSVDHLLVHLPTTKKTLVDWGISPERISVIEHGIFQWSDDVEYDSRAELDLVPGLTGVPDELVKVLFFGRMGEYKGLDLLIDAISKLDESCRNRIRLYLVGPAAYDIEPLVQRARIILQENLFVRSEFIPESDLQAYLRSADITVFPYREIDSSGALMTAMAYDTAILASDLETFKDVLEPGRCADFFTTGDDGSLAVALADLVASRQRRDQLIANLRKARCSNLSWPDIAGRTFDLYKSLRRD